MKNDENEKALILQGLEPLFVRARKEKLLFRSGYQDILFHPDELAREQKHGRFVWGAVNWTLESPTEELHILEAAVREAKKRLLHYKAKLVGWGYDDPRS
jgi:hypothetical protein